MGFYCKPGKLESSSANYVSTCYTMLHSNTCNTCYTVVTLLTSALISFSEHIDERKVCNAVSPDKDVDGFHVINVGRMCLDQCSMLPATPWGVWEIIKRTGRYIHLSIIKTYLENGKNSYRSYSGNPHLRSSSPAPQSLTPLAIAYNCFCCLIQKTLKEP